MIPTTLGGETTDDIIPNDVKNKAISLRIFIVENIKSAQSRNNEIHIIGSSTGGMTALLLSEKFNFKMYLINPLLAKEQFFDQNHPVGPLLDGISKKILSLSFFNNKIKIYLGINDELLNPEYTIDFAKSKNIEVITFEGEHTGTESLEMIVDLIKNS